MTNRPRSRTGEATWTAPPGFGGGGAGKAEAPASGQAAQPVATSVLKEGPVRVGFGRILASHYRASISYHVCPESW